VQVCRIWLQDSRIAGYAAGLQDMAARVQDMAAG
jgi:hypothetical protein